MKRYGWRSIGLIVFLFLTAASISRAETPDYVPEGVVMQDVFAPGFGDALGIFKKTVGRVVLIHAKDTLGYWAETDLPLYMKDTVITPEEGLALLQFLDDSTISVAADSELIINRFIFDPDKFDRSTFLSMQNGRARFWVKKLKDYARSEFKVKTKTLIAGVRGSDFVIVVSPRGTQVYALDDTILELISLADPSRVITLHSYESVSVNEGEPAGAIEKISPQEAARLRGELPMPFDRDVMEAAGIFESEKTTPPGGETAGQQPPEEIPGAAPGQPGAEGQGPPVFQLGEGAVILIPEDELVEPDPPVEGAEAGPEEPGDLTGIDPGPTPEDMAVTGDEIVEEEAQDIITEDVILVDLPGPPATP